MELWKHLRSLHSSWANGDGPSRSHGLVDRKMRVSLGIGVLAVLTALLAVPREVSSTRSVDERGLSATRAPSGAAWAAWVAEDGAASWIVFSRQLGTRWTAPQTLPGSGPWADDPCLAFDAEGTPWLAWTQYTGTGAHVRLASWNGQRWVELESVPAPPMSRSRRPALAAEAGGGLWLAWVGFDGVDDEVYAAHWDGAIWSPVVRVSSDDTDSRAYDTQPRVAVAADGVVFLVWVSSEGLLDDQIHFSRFSDHGWTPQQRVDLDDESADTEPAFLVDADGQAWLAWQGVVQTESGVRWRIFATHWNEGAAKWEPERMVSSPPELAVQEQFPSLSVDERGLPQIVWTASGRAEGLARAQWEGDDWSAPSWIVAGVFGSDFTVLDTSTDLLWLERGLHSQRIPDAGPPLPLSEPGSTGSVQGDGIVNRYLALGDSITWGQYNDVYGNPVGPYPAKMEYKLDTTIVASEVINRGVPGERSELLLNRVGSEVLTYLPQFVLLMEGTNDVTHNRDPNYVITNFLLIYDAIRYHLGLSGIRQIVGTIVPRLDGKNYDTQILNVYFRNFAVSKNLPLADNWQAFYDYGAWGELYVDLLHPDGQGLQIIADTFYTTMIENHFWLVPDTTPPVAAIDPLPPQTVCRNVPVSWSGSDGSWGTGVESFDVQVKEASGYPWEDWLTATTESAATYPGGVFGQPLSFRVRARDRAGNLGDYSAPATTTVVDQTPPAAYLFPLRPAEVVPFEVRWRGEDACGEVTHYTVQYQRGEDPPVSWLVGTSATAALFDPSEPQFGETYLFRVRARDEAGNWSGWSDPVTTLLAQFALSGEILTNRDEPVAFAGVIVTDALAVDTPPGGYVAFLGSPGEYELSASRYGFGQLPPMRGVSVTHSLAGLDFVLPPVDDVVKEGGFEGGAWGHWQPGGTLTPTLGADPHTGHGAALLGGPGELAWLRQRFTVPEGLADATLSFLIRLDSEDDLSSTLDLALQGTTIRHTQVISAGGWTHVWLPVEAAAGQVVTLTFTLSNTPAVELDEVSLGSAHFGGGFIYLPIVVSAHGW